jgi:hypothetical protein
VKRHKPAARTLPFSLTLDDLVEYRRAKDWRPGWVRTLAPRVVILEDALTGARETVQKTTRRLRLPRDVEGLREQIAAAQRARLGRSGPAQLIAVISVIQGARHAQPAELRQVLTRGTSRPVPRRRKRTRSGSYLDFVRSHPCCCGRCPGERSEAHHAGEQLWGKKPDDHTAVPLSLRCHNYVEANLHLEGWTKAETDQHFLRVQVSMLTAWATGEERAEWAVLRRLCAAVALLVMLLSSAPAWAGSGLAATPAALDLVELLGGMGVLGLAAQRVLFVRVLFVRVLLVRVLFVRFRSRSFAARSSACRAWLSARLSARVGFFAGDFFAGDFLAAGFLAAAFLAAVFFTAGFFAVAFFAAGFFAVAFFAAGFFAGFSTFLTSPSTRPKAARCTTRPIRSSDLLSSLMDPSQGRGRGAPLDAPVAAGHTEGVLAASGSPASSSGEDQRPGGASNTVGPDPVFRRLLVHVLGHGLSSRGHFFDLHSTAAPARRLALNVTDSLAAHNGDPPPVSARGPAQRQAVRP